MPPKRQRPVPDPPTRPPSKRPRRPAGVAAKPAGPGTDLGRPLPSLPNLAKLETLVEWLAQGRTEFDIRAAMSEHWPGEPVDDHLDHALTWLANAGDCPAAVLRGFVLTGFQRVYALALARNELPTALAALKAIEKSFSRG